MSRVEIEIPPNPVYAGVARLAVAALARAAGVDEQRVEELKIAAGEACANAVLANEGSGEPVMLVWAEKPDALVLEVADRGDLEEVGPGERMAMSVALLESLVDEYRQEPRADGGICVTLSLRR